VPVRLAFVGQRVFFELCSLEHPADGIEPTFIDFRHDADPRPLRAQLEALDADVIWVWRPEIVPPGLLHGLRAQRVGYLTEPLPRPGDDEPHHDLTQRLDYLKAADPANYDRIVSFDPLIVPTVEQHLPVWRSLPIPVADRVYGETNGGTQAVFVGRSTAHRESFLGPAKHDFDVIHVAHGFSGERLIALLRESAIVINLHNEPYPTFENRVPTALAAAALVVSEPLSPDHGLRASADYVEIETPWDLWRVLSEHRHNPAAFQSARASGRREAERFRASKVFPRLVADLLDRGPARLG
jgi:hypothetical protein